jgi:hypothetical protein
MEDLDLEAENDGPDEPEDHPGVPVNNVLRTDVLQAHLSQEKASW